MAGTYLSEGESVFMAAAHVVHDRGNVGYLISTTATLLDHDLSADDRTDVIDAVSSVNFVD